MALSLEDLQHQATAPQVSVVALLQRALILSSALHDADFAAWVRKELSGYEKSDSAPHRMLNGQYVALTANGPLPIVFEGSDMNQRFITLPISEIQALVAEQPKSGCYAVKVQIDPTSVKSLDLEPGETIAFSVTRSTLVRLVDAVKTAILEWSLKHQPTKKPNDADVDALFLEYLDNHCTSPDQSGKITVPRKWKNQKDAPQGHAKELAALLSLSCAELEAVVSRLEQKGLVGKLRTNTSLHLWITAHGQELARYSETTIADSPPADLPEKLMPQTAATKKLSKAKAPNVSVPSNESEAATKAGRDDFPRAVVELLAKRVGQRCSNPGCEQLTSGPHTDNNKALNVGVAAHIAAASAGGPRYDLSMSSEQRSAIDNGIWLCQICAKLVDNDVVRYPVTVLRKWRVDAEAKALTEIETRGKGTNRTANTDDHSIRFAADEWQVWKERGNLPGDGIYVLSGWKRGDVQYSCTLRFRNDLDIEDQLRLLRIEFRQGATILFSDKYPFREDLLVLPPKKWMALEVSHGLHDNVAYEQADSVWFSAETVGDKQKFAWRVAEITAKLTDLPEA